MMRKTLLVVASVPLLYLLLLWSEWLPRSTPEQQAALALMEQPPRKAAGQRDAFPLLWTLYRDMPEAERAALLAADQQAFAALDAEGKPGDFRSGAEGRYPKTELDRSKLCPRGHEADCLAFVRAQPEPVRAELARQASLLARAAGLRQADHARYGFRASLYSPLPDMGVGPLQRTAAALQFVDGQVDRALDDTCRDLGSWRRLRAHTDMLILDMVGVAYFNDGAAMLAAMLAELPPGHPLPGSCAAALAALAPDELDQCDVWRGEFANIRNTLADLPKVGMSALDGRERGLLDRFAPLLINEPATIAGFAPQFAQLCRTGQAQAPAAPDWLARLFNPGGSRFFALALANYGDYRLRALDYAAMLQGLRTLSWLRGQADPAAAFAARPDDLKAMADGLRFDAAGQRLVVGLRQPWQGSAPEWALPLPGSRLPAAAPGEVAPTGPDPGVP